MYCSSECEFIINWLLNSNCHCRALKQQMGWSFLKLWLSSDTRGEAPWMRWVPGFFRDFSFFLTVSFYSSTSLSLLPPAFVRKRVIKIPFSFHNGHFHMPVSCPNSYSLLKSHKKVKSSEWSRGWREHLTQQCSQRQLAAAGKMYLVQYILNNLLF